MLYSLMVDAVATRSKGFPGGAYIGKDMEQESLTMAILDNCSIPICPNQEPIFAPSGAISPSLRMHELVSFFHKLFYFTSSCSHCTL